MQPYLNNLFHLGHCCGLKSVDATCLKSVNFLFKHQQKMEETVKNVFCHCPGKNTLLPKKQPWYAWMFNKIECGKFVVVFN